MSQPLEGPVAVVGAGVMGRGIAYVAAVAGAEVRLVDLDEGQLSSAVTRIGRDLDAGVERGKVDADAADRARGLLSTTTSVAEGC
ncbi:MAG: 3-hydroxybutyryl-CoA dehydrogenase, partial [Actinobacteria bacterium]|nr:3-hydroxybutyryl-CoA dehydrogenase [Actinomycetota bacterium]